MLILTLASIDDPQERLELYDSACNANMETRTSERTEMQTQIKSNIEKAQKKQKDRYDRIHGASSCFSVNSVALKKDSTRKKRKGGKLDYRWTGPYIIIASLGKGLFKLKEIETNNVSPIYG